MRKAGEMRSVYENVIEKLLAEIECGNFKVSERLPSERDLAERLGVSRGSLREALRALEQQKIIQTYSDGRYVMCSTLPDNEVDSLYLDLEKIKIVDLLEAREILDDIIIKLACIRATERDLESISDCLEHQRRFIGMGVTEQVNYDNLFHLAIANAAHNSVFASIYSTNMELLNKIRFQSFTHYGRREEVLKEHAAILQALCDRDELMGRMAARLHMRNIKKRFETGGR